MRDPKSVEYKLAAEAGGCLDRVTDEECGETEERT